MKQAVTQLTCLPGEHGQKARKSPPSFLALHKKVHVCMCVCVQSVLWPRAPMDKWLGSPSVSQIPRVRTPLTVFSLFFCGSFVLFCFLSLTSRSLLAQTYICAAELATWGVGPDFCGQMMSHSGQLPLVRPWLERHRIHAVMAYAVV